MLPELHAAYGVSFSGHDLQGIFLEYDRGQPVALVEYRPADSVWLIESHPVLQAARRLADSAGIPMLIARYAPDFSEFQVATLNDAARIAWSSEGPSGTMPEQDFVAMLYRMRGREVPADVLAGLKTQTADTINNRHRQYGWDCPAVDVDLLGMSLDRGEPTACIEYKHERARPLQNTHPTVRACRKLADAANLPYWQVRYSGDHAVWNLDPLNAIARESHEGKARMMDQASYFAFLRSMACQDLDHQELVKLARRV